MSAHIPIALELAPDPATNELLAQAGTPYPTTPALSHAPAESVQKLPEDNAAFLKALQDGTIPTFDQLPDTSPQLPPPPVDVAAEQAAFAELVAFINQHKDPGTKITVLDPDAFVDGLD
jgi:hypothetical protein